MKLYDHPDYTLHVNDWQDYRTLYTGEGVNTSFLIKHEFETGKSDISQKMWNSRFARTEYTNLVEPFVNRFTAMCFSGENDFSAVDKLKDTAKNVDGSGLNFEDFFRRKVCKDLVLYGKPTVHVDAPEGKRVRPFLKTISPINIKSWKHLNGDLIALRYDYEFIEVGDLLSKPETKKLSDIYQIDGKKVTVSTFEKKGDSSEYKLLEEKVINIDMLPFAQAITDTRMKQCKPVLKAKHNLESAYDNQLLFQSIQRIIILGENVKEGSVVLNEGGIAVINGVGNIEVVEPSEPVSLERRIDTRLNDFFKIAFNQTRHMPSDSKASQSADTLKEGKEDFVKQVETCAKDLETLANRTFEIMCKFQGVDYNAEEDKIVIGRNLDPDDLAQQVNHARLFFDEISKYPTWRKETLKKLARSFNLKEIEEIEKEIDSKTGETNTVNKRLSEFITGGGQVNGDTKEAIKESR
jgi:hypothetical protein